MRCRLDQRSSEYPGAKAFPQEYRAHDGLLFQYRNSSDAQWSGDIAYFIIQGFADLISENFAHAFQVFPEAHPVLLDFHVPDLAQVLVDDGVIVTEVVNHNFISASKNP